MVQENANGEKHNRQHYEENEAKLTSGWFMSREKDYPNHSARKTVVKKLKSSGIPKCVIKNITGLTSAQGLDDYDSGDEREQQMINK